MKNYGKKISVYILCGLLSVSSLCGSYVQGVYAFEWVGGAIGFTEALSWLLASIGVTCAVTDYANTIDGSREAFWERYEDEMTTHMQESGITYPTISEWKEKLQRGILDKGSACWDAFKEWATSLISNSSSEDTLGDSSPASVVATEMLKQSSSKGWSFSNNATSVYSGFYIYRLDQDLTYPSGYPNVYLIPQSGINVFKNTGSRTGFWAYNNNTLYNSTFIIRTSNYYNSVTLGNSSFNVAYTDLSQYGIVLYNMDFEVSDPALAPGQITHIGSYGNVVSDFVGLDGVDVDNLDIISSDTPNEDDQEVAIPMPGIGTSDNSASSTAYDDIVDAINSGLITLDDGIAQIQDLIRVIVFDDTTDDVIPFQDDGEGGNKKKDDVIQDNKNNLGFTLGGLENVFPFCIPWDIYAFINLLNAEPEAPVFNLPFPNIEDPTHPLSIEVDLTPWDDAMRIFRLAEDFLFIIGLAFLTRSLIGAGGGDD